MSLGWFILFGIVGSLGDVPGMTAREALLPAIVRHSGVSAERLIGIREVLGAVALLLGPAAAGTLMVMFEGSTVLWVGAATSRAAGLRALLSPRRGGRICATGGAPSSPGPTSGWAQLREGWRVLFRSRFLVATTALSVVMVIVLASLQGLILPVYFTLEQQPGMLGFVLSALAAGMLVGGAIYAMAGTRGRRRVWFLVGLLGSTLGFGILATLSSVWVVFAGAFVVGLSNGLFGSLVGVLMIERIPEQMRGRIMGTQNAIMTAAPAIGIMGAAVLTEYSGVHLAAIVLAAFWGIALVIGLCARSLRNLESTPGQLEGGGTEGAVDA